MGNLLKRFVAEEDGLEILEYAILAFVLVAGLAAVYRSLATSVSGGLSSAIQQFSTGGGTGGGTN